MIELYSNFVQPILIILFIGIILYLHFRFIKNIEAITKYLLKKDEDKNKEEKNKQQ